MYTFRLSKLHTDPDHPKIGSPIVLQRRSMNPRAVWCYMGEDFMGKCRVLALASAKGTQPWQVGLKTLVRYLHALDLCFTNPAKYLRAIAAK